MVFSASIPKVQRNVNLVDLKKMLQNAPFLAIRGVDTAENEPSKVSMKWGSQTGVSPVMSRPDVVGAEDPEELNRPRAQGEDAGPAAD